MDSDISIEEEFPRDELFDYAMEKKWDKVAEIYKRYLSAHTEKLTNSEDTVLHVVISSYHPKCASKEYEFFTEEMVNCIPDKDFFKVLSMKNEKGNTPLHQAAAVGWVTICECIASKKSAVPVLSIRNKRGETPLFLAADHGHLDAFLCLYHIYKSNPVQQGPRPEPDISPCRRDSDGSTILHSAISGEYFNLAYQIICLYKKLVNCYNVEGELPLHILARKPNVFEGSNHFRFYDSFIYHCIFVHKLKELDGTKYNMHQKRPNSSGTRCPENYETCMNIYQILDSFISSIRGCLGRIGRQQRDEEKQQMGDTNSQTAEKEEEVLPIYATSILLFKLFKFASKVALIVIGVGFWRIEKLKRKKEIHSHALQIMNKMLESNKTYKYPDNGQKPRQNLEFQYSGRVAPPSLPPPTSDKQVVEHDQPQNQNEKQKDENGSTGTVEKGSAAKIGILQLVQQILERFRVAVQDPIPGGRNEKQKDENGSVMILGSEDGRQTAVLMVGSTGTVEEDSGALVRKETPVIVAAKMGILEMVKEILERFPVAIEDLDSSGKNVLMLAAEYRQTTVFNYLIDKNLPVYVFHQLDKHGNSIVHLAARNGEELEPWRIPGAALQLQWEIKWYKHVKKSIPSLGFAHHNLNGDTPRKIFKQTHQMLLKEGSEWLIKTSESCSVVAALVAGVAFGTSATVPGGIDENSGHPVLRNRTAFDVFSITSLVALCLSITALVFFLSIITSRCQERDFKLILPRKLLMGLSSLFAAIIAMLVSFCAGHTFILTDKLKYAAVPIYAVASVPVALFAFAQLPLYFDLLRATFMAVPLRSYKVFHQ